MTKTTQMRIKQCALLVAMICACTLVSSASDSILHTITELIDPANKGRAIGTRENDQIAHCLSERLEENGLIPLAGNDGFMIPFDDNVIVVEDANITLALADHSQHGLVYGEEFVITGISGSFSGTFTVDTDSASSEDQVIMLQNKEIVTESPNYAAHVTVKPTNVMHYSNSSRLLKSMNGNALTLSPQINCTYSAFDQIAEAVSVEIGYHVSSNRKTLQNVVGVIPGEDRKKAAIISAHFDGVGDQMGVRLPSALDNASGVAVVNEIMRYFSQNQPPYDIIIAFTNAEENGLSGSRALTASILHAYDHLYNINVDCVGLSDSFFPMMANQDLSALLCNMVSQHFADNGLAVGDELYGSSDHIAFEESGIPSVCIGTPDINIIHTTNDTIDNLDLNMIEKVAKTNISFIELNPDLHSVINIERVAEKKIDDVPSLSYDEIITIDDTTYRGTDRWMSLSEALSIFPQLPLPAIYKNCPIQACFIELSSFGLPNIEPSIITKLDMDEQKIAAIWAIYSDGNAVYSLEYRTYETLNPTIALLQQDDGYLVYSQETKTIVGVCLKSNKASIRLNVTDASELVEIGPGVWVNSTMYGTSAITEDNAGVYLKDAELIGLFEQLAEFANRW